MKILNLIFAIAVVTMFCGRPAFAQGNESAVKKFREGAAYFQKDNYPAALQAFEESYRINPKVALLFNIAMCQKALYLYVESMKTFEKYLTDGEGAIPKDNAADAQEALEEMAGLVGTLVIEEAPDGAATMIDGVPVGSAPFSTPLTLNPGNRAVHVTKEGYEPFDTQVEILSGAQSSVSARLSPLPARLAVDCRGTAASVRLDDREPGECPFAAESVLPGAHTITITSPGYRDFSEQIELQPGKEFSVSVSLTPVPPPPPEPTAESLLVHPAAPPPAPPPVDSGRKARVIGGAISLVLGAGMIAMGGVYTHKGKEDRAAGESVGKSMKNETNRDTYDELKSSYNDYKNDVLPRDNVLQAVGYAVGGVLVTTGLILSVLKKSERKPVAASVEVHPTLSGFAVRF